MMASGAYFYVGVQPQNRASLPCFVGSQGLSSGQERFFKQSLAEARSPRRSLLGFSVNKGNGQVPCGTRFFAVTLYRFVIAVGGTAREVRRATLPLQIRTHSTISRKPTTLAALVSTPASGPKAPPVKRSGPLCSIDRNVAPTGSTPLTGNPKTLPSKKFQAMCSPMGKASLPLRT